MDKTKINLYLNEVGAEFLTWRKNPSAASHMGGVLERQIRSTEAILSGLLKTHGTRFNDESFRNLLVEVEAIINSRPLTTDSILDHLSNHALTPMHLLKTKTKIALPPPGTFERTDVYSRKRWRRVQQIVNEFWSRWRTEYLSNLHWRHK